MLGGAARLDVLLRFLPQGRRFCREPNRLFAGCLEHLLPLLAALRRPEGHSSVWGRSSHSEEDLENLENLENSHLFPHISGGFACLSGLYIARSVLASIRVRRPTWAWRRRSARLVGGGSFRRFPSRRNLETIPSAGSLVPPSRKV